jgi:TetR/AcrR family transcriptional regulator, transcriptional repressor for nem operon
MPRARKFDPEQVLDQAVEAFWSHGYEGASIQGLCGAMAVNPPSLYAAFGDKRSLHLAALQRYTARSQTAFRDAIGEAQGAEGLRRFFSRLSGRLSGPDGSRGCLITNTATELARHDEAAAQRVSLHYAAIEEMLARLLAEAQARGELKPGAGPQSAGLLLCLAQGMNVMARTGRSPERLSALADEALATVLAEDGSPGAPI